MPPNDVIGTVVAHAFDFPFEDQRFESITSMKFICDYLANSGIYEKILLPSDRKSHMALICLHTFDLGLF